MRNGKLHSNSDVETFETYNFKMLYLDILLVYVQYYFCSWFEIEFSAPTQAVFDVHSRFGSHVT